MHIVLSSWTYHDALYQGARALAGLPAKARALGFDAVELQDMFLWPRGTACNAAWRGFIVFHWSPISARLLARTDCFSANCPPPRECTTRRVGFGHRLFLRPAQHSALRARWFAGGETVGGKGGAGNGGASLPDWERGRIRT